ncbi:unnamed protein product [Didymodactylos carnosus]|uniref:Uncharacterized protein n=1 Tax=Didymodactylos carnosus TaxID=1234261 RepID=A0A816A9R1_9BILA|nr:unnamed protein product [Didymodactylos carnosus]CAF4469631.1 unnamed protein product [Didymodactylos carnosus]
MAKQIVYMLSLVVFVWAYVFSTIDANPHQLAYNQGGDYHLKHSKSHNVDDEDSHTKQAKLNALYEDSTGKKHELNKENRDHALQKHKEADSELEEKRNHQPHRYAGKGSDSDSSDSNGYGSESRDDKYNRHPRKHAGKGSDSDSSDSNGYGSESRDDKYNRHPRKHAGKGSDSDSSDSNDYGNEHRDERVKRGAPEHAYHSSSRHDVPKSEVQKKKSHLVENENEKDGSDVVNERYR